MMMFMQAFFELVDGCSDNDGCACIFEIVDSSAVFQIIDGSTDVFEVVEDGGNFKLCISAIISGA